MPAPRRPRRALLVTLAVVLAGCDALLNLGPSATLVTPLDGASSDASTSDGSGLDRRGFVCGLPPHPMESCRTCIQTDCCDEYRACSGSERCKEGASCTSDCDYETACITRCAVGYRDDPAFAALLQCSSSSCANDCVPSGACYDLLQCCYRVADPTIRSACVRIASDEDETKCEDRARTVYLRACEDDGG